MHQYFHTNLGFCLWDVLALIVFIAMVVVLVVHLRNQKKRQNELDEELSEREASAVSANGGK